MFLDPRLVAILEPNNWLTNTNFQYMGINPKWKTRDFTPIRSDILHLKSGTPNLVFGVDKWLPIKDLVEMLVFCGSYWALVNDAVTRTTNWCFWT